MIYYEVKRILIIVLSFIITAFAFSQKQTKLKNSSKGISNLSKPLEKTVNPIYSTHTNSKSFSDNENILVKIGDKIITVDDYIRRAEYVVRPRYCAGNSGLEKKIILNSLIAEKLISLEYGKKNLLLENEHYKRYLLGRQEQVMRQLLYYDEGYKKVMLDTNEIRKKYKIAGRTYDIKYITAPNDSIANDISLKFDNPNVTFEKIYYDLTSSNNYPMAKIDWKCKEDESILNAIFSDTFRINQRLKPFKVNDTCWMFIEIKGWIYRPAITEKAAAERWKDVSEKLTEEKSYEIYSDFISRIMKGKKISFFETTFFKYVNLVAPFYLKSRQQDQMNEFFLSMTFKRPIENPENNNMSSLSDILNENIFEIDGKSWTVADLQMELEKHPLVFRKKKIKNSEFAENLKLAIVDMVRDRYLTEAAYDKGYNKLGMIKNNTEMWKDAEFSLFWKINKVKEKIIPENETKSDSIINRIIISDIEPEIDHLQKKYSDIIYIDTEKFNKIKLTKTPMLAIQKNVPFPLIVPSFPQLTTDNKLDYGKKINNN